MSADATPLASTAMAAARELAGDATNQLSALGHRVPPNDFQAMSDEYAAIIQKHFQPLLAKVEGERDAARKHADALTDGLDELWMALPLYGYTPGNEGWLYEIKKALSELTALRADLAAKEAALTKIQRDAHELTNSLRSTIQTIETIDADERFAAREDGRSAHVHTSVIKQSTASLAAHGLEVLPALASRAGKGGEKP